MTLHERTVELASDALTAVYSDTSVGQEKTMLALKTLRGEIDTMIETIRVDLQRDERE